MTFNFKSTQFYANLNEYNQITSDIKYNNDYFNSNVKCFL